MKMSEKARPANPDETFAPMPGRAHFEDPSLRDLRKAGFVKEADELQRLRRFHSAWWNAKISPSEANEQILARRAVEVGN